MRITVTIPKELAASVEARGISAEAFVQDWIAMQSASQASSSPSNELSLEEFNASLDRLTRYSEKIPSLPIQSFSRESFYEEHD